MIGSFLQNYLSSRGKSWKDLRQEALQSIEQGKYDLTGKPAGVKAAELSTCFLPLKKATFLSFICPCQIAASPEVPSCASTAACEL